MGVRPGGAGGKYVSTLSMGSLAIMYNRVSRGLARNNLTHYCAQYFSLVQDVT